MAQPQQTQSIDDLRAQVSRMLESLPPETPIAATVVFQVDRTKERTFLHNADVLTEATRQLPGCQVFGFHRHKSIQYEPEHAAAVEYLIFEEWTSRVLFQVQWNSAHLRHFQYSVGNLVVAPPDLNFYHDAAEVRPAAAHVLQTGQTHCWDASGAPISCAGTGQDGDIKAGVRSPMPRFTDNGNGTVTDNLSGLIWLKNANRFGEVTWEQALTIAKDLASGRSGLSDGSQRGQWRLPNINELQSLMHLDNLSGPALIAGHPFTNVQAANYWSSTTVASAPPLGWYTALAVGPPVFDLKVNLMRMWPVRGTGRIAQTGLQQCYDASGRPIPCAGTGQDGDIKAGVPFPTPRFTDNGDGTVTDNLTGLIWLKNAHRFGTRSWDQALRDCHALASGSHGLTDGSRPGTWRLPNVNELRSLVDYNEFGPTLSKGHPFINVQPTLYWSSTTVPSAPNLARFLFIGLGSCVCDHKSVLMCVWPVKGER
jgi:quinol monooxygenase YgiN